MIATMSLQMALDGCPRVSLGDFPTPLDAAPRLSERLGVRILVKRDDLTGLALGGNKVRKLEFLMGAVRAGEHDCVITTGGSQSNHARLTAAACVRLGLDCHLVLDRGLHPEMQGNLLLDGLFGAEVHLIESEDRAVAVQEMETLAERLRTEGRNPYIIPRGGSTAVGVRGYMAAAIELTTQLTDAGIDATHVYLGTGSTGTHSGLLSGLLAIGSRLHVQGISVSGTEQRQMENISRLAPAALAALDLSTSVEQSEIHVDDRFVGEGYGHVTPRTLEAIEMAARAEALVLDPVYTGKALAGLIAHAHEGRIGANETVVFMHTGGSPALFAYHQEVAGALGVAVTV